MWQLLLILSVSLVDSAPCPEFSCTSGDCVLFGDVCDFKKDCQDGSDEEFCGSCDFEHHSCGWKNIEEGKYAWTRQRANGSAVPGHDHTTETPQGYVMRAVEQEGASFQEQARLEFTVDRTLALGCSMSFWYHTHDSDTITSSDLNVKMVRGSEETVLLSISKANTDGWENAEVFIGNQPKGYSMQFVSELPFLGEIDIKLDDILFSNCAEGDMPPASDQLSCDFEEDTCAWYHDLTAGLLWERRKKEFGESSEVTGYHMIRETTSGDSSSARLMSFPQTAKDGLCVSFRYLIFGNSVDSLKFITKHPGEEETVVWMRIGTQGNKWRFADLTFDGEKPIQFIIEAAAGGGQGSIAIDNIVVFSASNGSCPAERECTFQGSLCGLQPVGELGWTRVKGSSLPTHAPGPRVDHTLGTDQGYYLSSQLWSQASGAKVTVLTAEMETTPAGGECLMFWYHMEGLGVGEMNVYLQNGATQTPLWSRQGDQGKHWRHGRITLISPLQPFQVVFEAMAGHEEQGNIALDDLIVLNDACPPQGFCDFEMDFCGWVNSPPTGSGLYWDWLSGSSSGSIFIPGVDHSLGSRFGHFAFFSNTKPNETVRLESELMGAVEKACLEMWHYTSRWSVGYPSDYILTAFIKEEGSERPLWSTNGFLNSSWIPGKVDYESSGLHQIVLEATCPKPDCGSISLDDVYIMRDRSCGDLIPTTPAPPTTPPPPASAMDCTFERGLCSWAPDVATGVNWTLSNGRAAAHPWDGPPCDHTVGNYEGVFLLLNGSGSEDGEKASISAPLSGISSEFCVEFWFFMSGPAVSSLDLLVQTSSATDALVWTRAGTQDGKWVKSQVNIVSTDATKLMFTAHRNTNSRGFIALDDVAVRSGQCQDKHFCGFDAGLCGYQHDISHVGRWVRTRATQGDPDRTYGTDHGFYMSASSSNSSYATVAQLLTPEIPAAAEMCVRFWYQLPPDSSNSLAVHLLWSGELHKTLWESYGSASTHWEAAEVTVWAPAKFHVVFKALHVPGTNSSVKLDDVSLKTGACGPRGGCDFESGQCTWVNRPTEGGHDWVLASKGKPGPSADHTTQTPDGVFLLSSPQHLSHGGRARVESEWVSPREAVSCLSLWSFVETSESGTLQLHVRTGRAGENLTLSINTSAQEWTRFSHSLPTNSTPFRLSIEADTKLSGYFAIDDISIEPGPCFENGSSPEFLGCTFENDTCGWADESTGQLRWTRDRNGTGPSVDNTLGNELGWYMAVKESRMYHESTAVLLSPPMEQTSANCTLSFYNYMNGPETHQLRLFLQSGLRSTFLWWGSGGHGDQWRGSEVAVGRVPHDFRIRFDAWTSTESGLIALDDISFSECSLPEPQPSCPETMFTCTNRACVELSRVCDFSDDCGDRSDEADCEEEGVTERCSFENSLCFWANNMADAQMSKWTLHTGQEGWPDLGPPRDHTKNLAAGHYIAPSLVNGQVSEVLSRTLLPSAGCRMRFFYFSLSDVGGDLTVWSRTRANGQDDALVWSRGDRQSYSWQRAEAAVSAAAMSKVVFRYEREEGSGGLVAVDDVSFSGDCQFDPGNAELPDDFTTSAPVPSSSTVPEPTPTSPGQPCQGDEFHCWMSEGTVCVKASAQCDYHKDCPQGEDENGCGPCTFEHDQCGWTDISDGPKRWTRQKSSNITVPSMDHTTQTGHYMRVDLSDSPPKTEASLQSSTLSPTSPYCQLQFHFYIKAEASGSLSVLMQQEGGAAGGEEILWSRSQSTADQWTPESLMLGQRQKAYKIWFSSLVGGYGDGGNVVMALDDIDFINCETSFKPPAWSLSGCSFENGLCGWLQGADDNLDWTLGSGSTDTPNTGPTGDHTTGDGKYLYLNTSSASLKGKRAHLKSTVLPPAGEHGYCFSFWYHMFGPTVGSLKLFFRTADPFDKTLVWQRSGNHGNQWQLMRTHVTAEKGHQWVLEATVGGEAGDVAIDDITLTDGPCADSGVCDFEEDTCGWSQGSWGDAKWVRQTGAFLHPAPHQDHTTNTAAGHYLYFPSDPNYTKQTAVISSPQYNTNADSCVQLWYHMLGQDPGTLNVYQKNAVTGSLVLLYSQTGDQGPLWRLARGRLQPQVEPYSIVVEGERLGPSEGGIAFDDVQLTDSHCPPPGHCDFETNMCSWTNVGQIDQADWLRGTGASVDNNAGPPVDHTTNSSRGHYVYVYSRVGQWGDQSFLISEVFQPSTRGHCITFWYYIHGHHVGTLKLHVNNRRTYDSGNVEGILKWTESGHKGDQFQEASVFIEHEEPFWFVFVYQKGMVSGGVVALDDITIAPFPCYSEPPIDPAGDKDGMLTVGLAVGLTLLAGVVISAVLFILNRRRCSKEDSSMDSELIRHDALDLSYSNAFGTLQQFNGDDPAIQGTTSTDA